MVQFESMKQVYFESPSFCRYFIYCFILSPKDQYYQKANSLAEEYTKEGWITTDAVIFETLNWFSNSKPYVRIMVSEFLEKLFLDPRIDVVTGGRNWLIAVTEFYRKRKDKAWSGVDCFSMLVMESKGVRDVLTTDHHFKQAGFNPLILEE